MNLNEDLVDFVVTWAILIGIAIIGGLSLVFVLQMLSVIGLL